MLLDALEVVEADGALVLAVLLNAKLASKANCVVCNKNTKNKNVSSDHRLLATDHQGSSYI